MTTEKEEKLFMKRRTRNYRKSRVAEKKRDQDSKINEKLFMKRIVKMMTGRVPENTIDCCSKKKKKICCEWFHSHCDYYFFFF